MKAKVNCAFTKMVSLGKIKPHPRNPNRHPENQVAMLAALIKHHGWRAPITVSNLSGFVIRGHGRLLAAKKLGLKTAPIDYQDYDSEMSEIADMLEDNHVQEFSYMDAEEVQEIINEIKNADFDLDSIASFTLDEFLSEEETTHPEFSPVPETEQPILSEKKKIICPQCGCEF